MPLVVAGLETIAFQPKSGLYRDLTDLFQKGIDTKNAISKKTFNLDKQVQVINDFCKKTIEVEFPKIAKKHLGVLVDRMYFSEYPDCGFWVASYIKSWENAEAIENRYTGANAKSKTTLTAKELIDLIDTVNDEKGTISYDNKGNKPLVGCVVGFDPYTAFFTTEVFGGDNEPFTAEELAAIMIHELGHFYLFVSHAADKYLRISTLNDQVMEFAKKAPISEKVKLIKDIASRRAASDKNGSNLKAVADNMETAMNDPRIPSDPKNMSRLHGMVVMYSLYLLIDIIFQTVSLTITDLVRASGKIGGSYKHGDIVTDAYNTVEMNEMLADQFATRHGAGAALASGLNRLCKCFSSPAPTTVLGNTVAAVLRSIGLFIMFCISSRTPLPVHPEDVKRIKLIMQQQMIAFKSNLPKEQLKHYVAEYEATMKTLKDLESRQIKGYLAADKFWSVVGNMVNPATFINLIFTGRFTKDYDKLLNEMRVLKDSPFYFQSAKLLTLIPDNEPIK